MGVPTPGFRPAVLIASGRRAPSTHRAETVHPRADDCLVGEMRGLGGTTPRLPGAEEVPRMPLPAVRADHRTAET
ncbi:thioesterase domain-containing protein (plasmid) [Streptomyces sp. NBC_01136]|uniref:thioesterase domain-containing protein n=1 Tax=unclassified Streptomyces TaxID=2593676 RepID=UPI002F916166|nr:thioesterase domain-containing protein [Streptomyces sp. NBC_01136]